MVLSKYSWCLMLAASSQMAQACGAPPQAVIDIDANSYYSDSHYSIIDPARKARNEAATKPVSDFLEVVARSASAYQAKLNQSDAECSLSWLASWAGQNAMLGRMTTMQSYYTRKWALASLALSYARVQHAAASDQRQVIEAWLKSLADATIKHSDQQKGARNNHYYWEGLAVAATGAATGDQHYLRWARNMFDYAMNQVQADGTLPLELNRAGKALQYHVFSAEALVFVASILDVQSEPLDRLVKTTLDGVSNPASFEQMTGFEQEVPKSTPGWKLIYDRHTALSPNGTPAKAWTARLGGDLTLPNPLEHLRLKPAA
ncbi:alginate lyase family protein [Pseudoduganella violaceinigra]|uniref:alginate lyase family protein n=1 Tax=Pseudoduganella violaceinigra TaxID=246602 RepID=UPI001E3F166E|nr:alginate lyase family protein [Pseudoduganella violaceinigra]